MNEGIEHASVWGLAVIVVASWVLYRYLAPKTWPELWRAPPWSLARSEERRVLEAFKALESDWLTARR